jgi:hypothetical protein
MNKSPWWKGNAPDFDWSVLGQVVYRHSCECVTGQTSSGTAPFRRLCTASKWSLESRHR